MMVYILAGGRGSRLAPLTQNLPKPLVPFFGRPLIEHQILWLASYGLEDIVVSLGHFGSQIERTLGTRLAGARLHYVYESEPQGTAGAVALALKHFPSDDGALVIAGDCLTDFDLTSIVSAFSGREESAGLVVHRVTDARQFGVVDIDSEGRVTRLIEKPPVVDGPMLVNTGIYLLRPTRIIWPPSRPLDFAYDVLPALIAQNQLAALEGEGYWSDLGTLTQYRTSHFDAIHGRIRLPFDLDQEANITVDPRARIVDPVWLGDGVTIDAQATVGPNVVLGANSYVGPWTHVENAVVGKNTFLGAGTRVEHVIVGDRVAVGGRCRLGSQSAIGQDSRIGWGAEVTPGSRIPPATRLAPSIRATTMRAAVPSSYQEV